jgi:hypothetical protein
MTPRADAVADLRCEAGPRATAPADRAQRVEAAVRVEWQGAVQKRARRRRARWVAASCVTSAALIAFLLHAHHGQGAAEMSDAHIAYSHPSYVVRTDVPQNRGAYFRLSNDDRPPDRGVPRHRLVSYSGQVR